MSGHSISAFFLGTLTVATLPMFSFGYHTGVLNAAETVIFPGHSRTAWSTAVAAFAFGGMLGSPVAGRVADAWGRRLTLIGILVLNSLGGLAHVATPSMIGLILARWGVGLAGGAATVLVPLYLSEIAPPMWRGSIGTLAQLAVVMGIVASVVVPYSAGWRWIFVPALFLAAAGCLILAPRFLIESPLWLWRNNQRNEALKNFHRLHGRAGDRGDTNTANDADYLVEQLLPHPGVNALLEEPLSTSEPPNSTATEDGHTATLPPPSFEDYVRDPQNWTPLTAALLFPIAQQLSGINAVFYYSTQIFQKIGMTHPQRATFLAFGVNVFATLLAVTIMDRYDRKTLLSWSAGGMLVCSVGLTLALAGMLSSCLAVGCVLLYIVFFEIGLGCIPFFLTSEMIPVRYAGTVQSLAMAGNWLSNFAVGLGFPYLDHYLGTLSFVPFALILLLTTLFSILVLPGSRVVAPDLLARRFSSPNLDSIDEEDGDDEA